MLAFGKPVNISESKEKSSMRANSFLAAVCILSLPLWSSPTLGRRPINSAAFSTVAIAGHVTSSGLYCECDTPNCECESGEQSHSSANAASQQNAKSADINSELGVVLL